MVEGEIKEYIIKDKIIEETVEVKRNYLSMLVVTGVTRSYVPIRFNIPIRAYSYPSNTYARPTTTPIY
jgi:hypothetical protein